MSQFSAYFRVIPTSNSGTVRRKRAEQIRELQKVAAVVYAAVQSVDRITLTIPGGGQYTAASLFSNLENGAAVKPQFGDVPAQVVLTGIFSESPVDSEDSTTYPSRGIINTNELVTGQSAGLQLAGPSSTVLSNVVELRGLIDAAIAEYELLPDWVQLTWYKLDYKGIIFGHKGIHFPRS